MDKTCSVNKTLSRISKKWALLILRELNDNGKKRFSVLVKEMKGISPRTLTKRLRELEKIGLISRKKFNEIPPRVEYELTKKGKELIKIVNYIELWTKKFKVK
ncbi:MAG: transcriptional regulator [Candidatus Pacearchaeota archaeon]|nr:MAG: transcriptional regulator [Candidatus Pacearchaeota archaeon]